MSAFFNLLYIVVMVYELILLARVLMSWFPNVDRSNPLVQFVFDVTEPVLRPIREMLPQTGMLDLSPLIVFLILQVITQVLFRFF